jgi:pimeloyl-ACP methyl ester carboxylesterase
MTAAAGQRIRRRFSAECGYLRSQAANLAKSPSNSAVERGPGAAHSPQRENPGATLAVLTDFWGRQPPAASAPTDR